VAATTVKAVGVVIAVLTGIGVVAYILINLRQGRPEVGAEIELAANRKPYYDDEELEGRRLELVQLVGVLLLVVIVIGLPLYWIFEPDRQAGATEGMANRFVSWGALLFEPTGSNANAYNCAGCHGGMNAVGGEAPYNVADPKTGEVTSVLWKAPALNTVFYRFDEDEVRFILVYGRPFSPMSPWGLEGGGPMNDQQIDTLLAYLKSIQIEREDCGPGEDDAQICPSGHLPAETQGEIDAAARQSVEDGTYASYGEALFNLEAASGAFSCARCHTQGWSWGDPGVPGQGAFGWNLTGGSVNAHFPNEQDMIDFIQNGSVVGAKYGIQGQGSGRMPAFGSMLTEEQITAIVEYVRSL